MLKLIRILHGLLRLLNCRNAEEEVPLQTLNVPSSANEDRSDGRSSSRRESGDFAFGSQTADYTETISEDSTEFEKYKQISSIKCNGKTPRADSPSEIPDRLDTISKITVKVLQN